MSQERLNDLAILYIEKKICQKILMLTLLSIILHLEMLEDNVFYEHLYA